MIPAKTRFISGSHMYVQIAAPYEQGVYSEHIQTSAERGWRGTRRWRDESPKPAQSTGTQKSRTSPLPSKKNVPQTEEEKLKRKRRHQIIQKAQDLRNEDRDDVKEMNKMIMYAKVVTIRDKQLLQKK